MNRLDALNEHAPLEFLQGLVERVLLHVRVVLDIPLPHAAVARPLDLLVRHHHFPAKPSQLACHFLVHYFE